MTRSLVLLASIGWLAVGTLACDEAVTATRDPGTAPFSWPADPATTATVTVRDMGNIELALYPSLAPKTVENFVKLAREGFYDGTSFHRVIPGFMIQGGDPNSKNQNPSDDGHGGPGYTIDDEFTDAPHERGALSMANVGRPNSGGSQFFIVLGNAQNLDGKHTIFGWVLSGMDVVDAITEVDTDVYGRWGAKNRPIANVVIERIEISPGG
jgi:peptidyl-prolyl cis-trans isomerase B (cyclophilin B)